MWLQFVFILFLNTQNVVAEFNATDFESEEEWDTESSMVSPDNYDPSYRAGETATEEPSLLRLPEYVRIQASDLRKDYFSPEMGSMEVPPEVQTILLPSGMPAWRPSYTTAGKKVEVLCHLDRIYVRVQKSVFADINAWKNLKLGTCSVNKATASHYYFRQNLKDCKMRRREDDDSITYTNVLQYRPPITGLIVRDWPFTLPIRCLYPKFHFAYQVGFLPKISAGTMYIGLKNRLDASLTAMDASWNVLPDGMSFVLGQPICFEAKGPSVAGNRLYFNRCFVTPSPEPTSADRYVVVENAGCLVDSKNSAMSQYYTTKDNSTVRLCFAAFFFNNMVSNSPTRKTMFMHCEMFMAPSTPSPSSKSCTFDLHAKQWTEMYGDASVCECCESSCPIPLPTAAKSVITSKSWDLKLGRKPFGKKFLQSNPGFPVGGDWN
ncbi:zona pellucida sperm-binding protein 3 [Paramisgurnus dabryanus]|uniref:zona pellucida sperm-binding protein 3 n=1 Tax=Paramisgurnus dabryanus TaxID=90735 RepID=UPI003CCFBC64